MYTYYIRMYTYTCLWMTSILQASTSLPIFKAEFSEIQFGFVIFTIPHNDRTKNNYFSQELISIVAYVGWSNFIWMVFIVYTVCIYIICIYLVCLVIIPCLNVNRYWWFFFLHLPGNRVLFHVIYIHQKKSSVMTLQHQLRLGEDKPQAYSFLERKRLWLMAFLSKWSIVTPACYIALPAAHIAPYATIAWSVLITIVLGWANALDWYAAFHSNCNSFSSSF